MVPSGQILLKKKHLAGFCLVREVPSEKNGDGKEKEHDGRVAARPNLEVLNNYNNNIVSSVRSSNSHPDLLVIQQHHPLFQITPVLNTGLSLSEPLQLYKGYNAI